MDSVRKLTLGLQPSVAILKIWQGIVEIALRGCAIGVAISIFICAAVLTHHTKGSVFSDVPDINATGVEGARTFTHNTAIWFIFTALMSVIWETVAIILRFLNISIVDRCIGYILIVDIVVKVIFILSWLIGFIMFIVIGTKMWDFDETLFPSIPFSTIKSSSKAIEFFSIVNLVVHIALTVWMVVWLRAKWQENVTRILRATAPKKVCFMCESPVDSKFEPCGHCVMCAECGEGAKRCPTCKKPVNNLSKLEEMCPMCDENQATVTMQPCAHKFCSDCSSKIKVCFECKTQITSKEGLPPASTQASTRAASRQPAVPTCQICYDRPINAVYQCGHQFCWECAQAMHQCPVCRQRVRNRIQLIQ